MVESSLSPATPLENPTRHPRLIMWLVVILLAIHTLLLGWGAYIHSPTTDEPAQLVAGISHWELRRFELYRVTGPLVRMVAAIPVMGADPEVEWRNFRDYLVGRAEHRVGIDFIHANGARTLWLVTLGRWALIPFSLLGLYVCFLWGRDLFGSEAGLLAAILWCFSPTILGNAPLIMTDVPGAAFFLAASFVFWHWLRKPNWETALLAGLLLGLLQLTKATFIIVFALWPILWLLYRSVGRTGQIRFQPLRESVQMTAILLLGVCLLNLGYGFEGTFQKLGDYRFVSRTFAGSEQYEKGDGNRFAGTWIAGIPVPLPENYVRGIDVQRRYFDRKLRSYLRGEWKLGGWWYYYLYAMAIKIPLGTWIIALLGMVMFVEKGRRYSSQVATVPSTERPQWRDEMALLLPLFAILILVSSQTGFNKNFRYVLPCLPLLFVWVSRVASLSLNPGGNFADRPAWTRKGLLLIGSVALCWSVGSSLWFYPHSLSYFNELVGGPRHGHEHLIHSNIDFGQDLLHLQQWINEKGNGRPVYIAYYGIIDPLLIGIDYELPPRRIANKVGNPQVSAAKPALPPGFYAVSVNLLHGHRWGIPNGHGAQTTASPGDFSYFLDLKPIALAGYSIYIYEVPDDANPSK